jgi:signal transduction histidine kinase
MTPELETSIAHEIAALRTGLETSLTAIEKDPAWVAEMLSVMTTYAAKTEEEVRELLEAVGPVRPVADLGLADVIGPVIADFHSRRPTVDLSVQTSMRHGQPVDPAIRETLYFVLREALDIAARKGATRSVRIVLQGEPEAVGLIIADDSPGFDSGGPENVPPSLLLLRERALLAGGELQVDSSPEAGMTIALKIGGAAGSVAS